MKKLREENEKLRQELECYRSFIENLSIRGGNLSMSDEFREQVGLCPHLFDKGKCTKCLKHFVFQTKECKH